MHAATNTPMLARLILNTLHEAGINASGWDNGDGKWFLTPEILESIETGMPIPHH